MRRRRRAETPRSELPETPDFVVLGLGNPGEAYRRTRHNFGFLVTDALARAENVRLSRGPGPCVIGPFTVDGNRGILAQPRTWMNRSGIAARAIRERFGGPDPGRFLVVTDDLDLSLGRIRFRPAGGAGGHKGLSSLIEELGTQDFPRLRLGIGRPPVDDRNEVVDYVLEPFREEEAATVATVVERAVEGVRVFLVEGIDAAMSRFNAQ